MQMQCIDRRQSQPTKGGNDGSMGTSGRRGARRGSSSYLLRLGLFNGSGILI